MKEKLELQLEQTRNRLWLAVIFDEPAKRGQLQKRIRSLRSRIAAL